LTRINIYAKYEISLFSHKWIKIEINNMENLMKINRFINTRISNAGFSPVFRLIFIKAGVNYLKLVDSLIFGQDAIGT